MYFYPRSPCGERLTKRRTVQRIFHFYPRSPCGERLLRRNADYNCHSISIHALLAESDPGHFTRSWRITTFLSTLSLRRATSSIDDLEPSTTHFYPRSPCGERLIVSQVRRKPTRFLSTLSLRRATLAIHAKSHEYAKFLSTLSLRRATAVPRLGKRDIRISIHALLAESD